LGTLTVGSGEGYVPELQAFNWGGFNRENLVRFGKYIPEAFVKGGNYGSGNDVGNFRLYDERTDRENKYIGKYIEGMSKTEFEDYQTDRFGALAKTQTGSSLICRILNCLRNLTFLNALS